MIKKKDRAVRKPKGKRAQKNSNARGHAQITRKSDNQDKVSILQQSNEKEKKRGANQRRAAKENMNDVKSQTIDRDLQSLKP